MSEKPASGISFSLNKGKKGFVKPVALSDAHKDGESDEIVLPKQKLVIPLKEGTASKVQAEVKPVEGDKYDAKKYGLQVRSSTSSTSSLSSSSTTRRTEFKPERKDPSDADFKKDLRSLPEAPQVSAYGKMPVEEFGLAMLRGMGWDESKYKADVAARTRETAKRRPEFLGLGAKPGDPNVIKRPDMLAARPKRRRVEVENEKLQVEKHVRIVRGEHEGMSAVVHQILMDKLILLLASSGVLVEVDASETILEEHYTEQALSKEPSEYEPIPSVFPAIRIKIASKSFREGSLYQKLGTILDIHFDSKGLTRSTVNFDDGSLVHDVPSSAMIPVLPRTAGGLVTILAGKYAGHLGHLLRIHGGTATVQLIEDELVILELKPSVVSATAR